MIKTRSYTSFELLFSFVNTIKYFSWKAHNKSHFYLILAICKYFSALLILASCVIKRIITLFMTLYYLYLPDILKGKLVKNHHYLLQSADSAEFYQKLRMFNKRRKQSMYLEIRIQVCMLKSLIHFSENQCFSLSFSKAPFSRTKLCTSNFSLIKRILQSKKNPLLNCYCYPQWDTQAARVRLQHFNTITCSFPRVHERRNDGTSKSECIL